MLLTQCMLVQYEQLHIVQCTTTAFTRSSRQLEVHGSTSLPAALPMRPSTRKRASNQTRMSIKPATHPKVDAPATTEIYLERA
jgi:hypothetical protein